MGEAEVDTGRRRGRSKGDLREEAILAAAERQLASVGYESITVATLMEEAGGTRGGFYFYFRTKADAVAALVERTVSALHVSLESLSVDQPGAEPVDLIRELLVRTQAIWAEHGPVMSAAVELAPTVPAIGDRWAAARDAVTQTATRIAIQAGLPDSSASDGAAAVTALLVRMGEGAFYEATKRAAPPLSEVTATCGLIWQRCLGA
ncbi:TetR/AcrR family transcriptional regulator [Desertihabitans brevis]|uniref:TetR/AcrR family transcriptional regulator n=1 Tax=Desertihabitans brevis TaxID=2268447 RepID=A0A367YZ61_9ACTN|nr:TetR/AcrR family transcriptional regulator [Desertihabitans brevis]RCK70241.1 TetR/AcrR family transcriptional regulator [Desertihabitans brevis]